MQQPLLRWIWRDYLRRYRVIFLIAGLFMVIEGGMLGLLSWIIRPMFDQVLVAGDTGAIGWVAAAVFGIFLARAVFSWAHRVLMMNVGQKVSAQLQSNMLRHILLLDSSWFQTNPPGTLIERVRGDTQSAATLWSAVFPAFCRDLVSLISLFAVALYIDWQWTLIALAAAPALVAPVLLLQRLVRRTSRHAREIAAELSTRLDESFHGVDTIKLNRIEDREAERYRAQINGFVQVQVRSEAGQAAIGSAADIMAGLGFCGVLYYGGYQIVDGTKTVGEFMSFFTAIGLIFEPLRRVANVTGLYQAALASLERIQGVFGEVPTIVSPQAPSKISTPVGQADITFSGVSFSYGEREVLKNISFTAEAGKTTALVGASGAGKTTVFRLLTRLADPQVGHASLDGTSVSDLDLNQLRDWISVVTQDAQLFDETLRDNIVLGGSEAGMDEVLNAAHVADFLPSLPKGLDSTAGPRGSALSGGQKQRIAIARALLRDAPILLLDEATSALDAQSEAVVQMALDRLSEGRTTLVIAHRLATIRAADKIIVMDAGQVIDQGTHDELITRGGKYADLYRLQFST